MIWKSIFVAVGLILTQVDFVSDIWVGINLYMNCHYKFAAMSFFWTAWPSIVILLYSLNSLVFTSPDQFPLAAKDLIGLILCYPVWTCVIAVQGMLGHRNLSHSLGVKCLEVIGESMTQFVFTCYVRADVGTGKM